LTTQLTFKFDGKDEADNNRNQLKYFQGELWRKKGQPVSAGNSQVTIFLIVIKLGVLLKYGFLVCPYGEFNFS